MNCIDDFFEMIIDDCERNAFSQLDHQLQYTVGLETAMTLLKDNVCDRYDVPQKYKVYIAALAEYIFNQCNVKPPAWVYEEQFYLSEPVFSEGIELLCKKCGTDTLKQYEMEEAIPEFKKRNFMLSDVLSAI